MTVSPSPEQLSELLRALAHDCDNTDGWQDAAPTIRKAADALEATQAEIARLTTALEFYAYGIGYTEIEDGREKARAALKDSPNVGQVVSLRVVALRGPA